MSDGGNAAATGWAGKEQVVYCQNGGVNPGTTTTKSKPFVFEGTFNGWFLKTIIKFGRIRLCFYHYRIPYYCAIELQQSSLIFEYFPYYLSYWAHWISTNRPPVPHSRVGWSLGSF